MKAMITTKKRVFGLVFLALLTVLGMAACSDDVGQHKIPPGENNHSNDSNNSNNSDQGEDGSTDAGQGDASSEGGEQGSDGGNGYRLVASMVNEEKEAGDRFNFECLLYGPDGREVFADTVRHVEPGEHFERDEFGLFKAIKSGAATAYCEAPRYDVSSNRVDFQVTSARARTSKASVESSSILAGEIVQVQCEGWDEYGNEVSEKYALNSLIVAPNSQVTIDGLQVTFRNVGSYTVSCKVSGYPDGEEGTAVEVHANVPEILELGVRPYSQSFRVDDTVEVLTFVGDRFRNPVEDYEVEITHSANIERDGELYRFVAVGEATFTATLVRDSQENPPIQTTLQVQVR